MILGLSPEVFDLPILIRLCESRFSRSSFQIYKTDERHRTGNSLFVRCCCGESLLTARSNAVLAPHAGRNICVYSPQFFGRRRIGFSPLRNSIVSLCLRLTTYIRRVRRYCPGVFQNRRYDSQRFGDDDDYPGNRVEK